MSQLAIAADMADAESPETTEQLLPLVYHELRRLAAAKLAQEQHVLTLQTTALVHEAYLRLLGPAANTCSAVGESKPRFETRAHFMAVAAEAMRRILVERARRRRRLKRGGHLVRVTLDDAHLPVGSDSIDVLALDEALSRLAQDHPEKAELVKLRYFAGLTGDEAAAAVGISPATADRYWSYAKAWLYRELSAAAS